MSISRNLSENILHQVRKRAKGLCEYCHCSEQWQYVRFTIDHVIPISQGGLNNFDNLALACFHCNRKKTNKIYAIDSETKQEVSLFNPRLNLWKEHFIWSSNTLLIIGLTPVGRATIVTLNMNREWVINIRNSDREIGRHPPTNDDISIP